MFYKYIYEYIWQLVHMCKLQYWYDNHIYKPNLHYREQIIVVEKQIIILETLSIVVTLV